MGNLEVNTKNNFQWEDNHEEKTLKDQSGNLLISRKRQKAIPISEKRLNIQNPHLISPVSVTEHNITFPQFPHTLKQIISARRQQNLFQESELLALLRGVCSALASLQMAGSYHGQIVPENIFYEPSTGGFKIYDNELLSGNPSNYGVHSNFYYYSPEILQAIKENRQITNLEILSKSDIFSFGMVMLEAACLQSSSDCYNYQTKTLNYALLDQRLAFLRENYPIQLAHLIKIMITPDNTIRPECVETFKMVTNQGPGKVQVNVRKYNYEETNAKIMAQQGEPGLNLANGIPIQAVNPMINHQLAQVPSQSNLKNTQFISQPMHQNQNSFNQMQTYPQNYQPNLQIPQSENMNEPYLQSQNNALKLQVIPQEVYHQQFTQQINYPNHVPFQDMSNIANVYPSNQDFVYQSPKTQKPQYALNYESNNSFSLQKNVNPQTNNFHNEQNLLGNSMMFNQYNVNIQNQIYQQNFQTMKSPNQYNPNIAKSPSKNQKSYNEFRSPNYPPNTMMDLAKFQKTSVPENPHKKLEERLDEVMMRSRNLMQEIMGQLKKDSLDSS